MGVFHKKLNRLINNYKKSTIEKAEAEKRLLDEMNNIHWEDIEKIVHVIEEKGRPIHAETAKEISNLIANGKETADDIVTLQILAEANQEYIENEVIS